MNKKLNRSGVQARCLQPKNDTSYLNTIDRFQCLQVQTRLDFDFQSSWLDLANYCRSACNQNIMPELCSNLVCQKTYQLQSIADCYFGLSMVYRLILVAIYNFKFEENKIIRDDSGLIWQLWSSRGHRCACLIHKQSWRNVKSQSRRADLELDDWWLMILARE
jgi:hypothetical protein